MTEQADDKILEQIKKLLRDDPSIDDSKMEVEVMNGTVIIKGKADTEEEKEKAQLICTSVDGVNKLESHLTVEAGIAHGITGFISRIVADDKPDKKE